MENVIAFASADIPASMENVTAPASAKITAPDNVTAPASALTDSSSFSSKFTPLSLESLSIDKEILEGMSSTSQSLSDLIDSSLSSFDDPFKLRICSALKKLVKLVVAILAEGYFESRNSTMELSHQNTILRNEINKLKGDIQTVTLESDDLRKRNQDLRDLNQKRVMELYEFQFTAEDARSDNEKLQNQIIQLNNEHSYSLDKIENLTNENTNKNLFAQKQYDESSEKLTAQNKKIIQSKINLTVKMNQLREEYTQLKESHDALMKEKTFLSFDEKRIRSRLKGLVGNDFVKGMESAKNNGLGLAQYLISQREDSEKSYQSTISQLRSDLAKVHKERAKKTKLSKDISVALSSSHDRAERRFSFLQDFMEVDRRNDEKGIARQDHNKTQTLVNKILLSESLPPVIIPPLQISDDERLPEPDSDYDHVSD
ncbi:cytotardin-like [Papaver somniferum]|uniref:cytotardin-like n=1 Tax=Papaver somniferum TaxID=3469 RepID=UPI000E703CAC|nr:cytotardin-like [Papaver somniferum]